MPSVTNCKICGVALHADNKRYGKCKDCVNEQHNLHYSTDPAFRQNRIIYGRARNASRRLEVLTAYSGGVLACDCCGEDEVEFLSLDHINGGGTAERAAAGGHSHQLYLKLVREGFPRKEDYRVLCFNCNQSIGYYGYCPHQNEGEPD